MFNAWSKLPTERRHAKDLLDRLDIDFSVILDSVTIARSRKHIQKYYDTKDIGTFPSRLPVKSIYPKLTDNAAVMPYKEIYDKLLSMTMDVYAPLSHLQPSKTDKYEAKYQIDLLVTPEADNKLCELKKIIADKIAEPINDGNKKILIFSAFADTAEYLYDNLAPYMKSEYGLYSARIGGGNNNATNVDGRTDSDRLLTLFSPISKQREITLKNEPNTPGIDVLIGTDCISEGQNLQDCDICINYDIHWNPVRIVQRFGRIDRIGSKNANIRLVNFWPDISLDEYINLNKRVSARMTIVNQTATADDNIISEENEEMDYRKDQLKKLQEGTLQDLEDVDGNISITDLGLNDFVMDLHTYIKDNGEPKGVITGLHAVVAADESKGIEPGIIFVLRNRNNGVNINKQNRLHPYYLVYLKDDGEVIYNHLDVKSTLDVLRTTAKGKTEPIAELCRKFNRETKDGAKMDKYNALLDSAVASIIEVKEQNDLQSLFTVGSKVLFQQSIDGLDDFELVSFVVVK